LPRRPDLIEVNFIGVDGSRPGDSGEKGDRDLLVVLALVLTAQASDLTEVESVYATLAADLRYLVRSNLSLLSLLEPRPGMPDPRPHRAIVATLLDRLERSEPHQ
jgi:hypothetical protein